MPQYMDIHKNVKGLTPKALAEASRKDIEVQEKYGVKFVNYWYNEDDGIIFFLCEAPNKEAVAAAHREVHGGMADEIVEVKTCE